jgi:thiosulfate dehydrogenase [quinone] large subunit
MLPRIAPATALLPLRLFLGVTFVYAGIQKLGDPGFLHKGAPTYIGSQLHAFANGTPGGFILRAFAIPHPALAGVGVAFVEIAVGLLVLTGLFTQAAAAVGLALNLVLFLTNSWKTYPYFLGSDIVFVFAWLPFVLAGAAGQPALDHELERRLAAPRRRPRVGEPAISRRALIGRALGATGAFTLGIGGLAALFKGSYKGNTHPFAASAPKPAANKPAAAKPKPSRHRAKPSLPSGAVRLGSSSQLPAGQGATYRDPSDGQPDIVIRLPGGKLVAHSAVCTHAGCTVAYQGGSQIICPCHGGLYNAATGAVEGGPPPTGLAARKVLERSGSIYAVPS